MPEHITWTSLYFSQLIHADRQRKREGGREREREGERDGLFLCNVPCKESEKGLKTNLRAEKFLHNMYLFPI